MFFKSSTQNAYEPEEDKAKQPMRSDFPHFESKINQGDEPSIASPQEQKNLLDIDESFSILSPHTDIPLGITPSPESVATREKLVKIQKIVVQLSSEIESLRQILRELLLPMESLVSLERNTPSLETPSGDFSQMIEGVFNGQNMIGNDGHEYTIPANYASKSKLIEGDRLKLYIDEQGRFIYKQIQPIERTRLFADLGYDAIKGQYYAEQNGKRWQLLTASVTYFRGQEGDQLIILIPAIQPSMWAAVENIIKKISLQ